jgi:multimeric flavodoxin WrbA
MNTVTEAMMNYELHGIQMIPYTQVQERMNNLYTSELLWIEAGYGEHIPEWFIKEEDEKMRSYFESQKEVAPDDDVSLL